VLESWVAASSNFFLPHPQLRCPYMERDQARIGSTSSHSDVLCSPMKTQFTWTSIAVRGLRSRASTVLRSHRNSCRELLPIEDPRRQEPSLSIPQTTFYFLSREAG